MQTIKATRVWPWISLILPLFRKNSAKRIPSYERSFKSHHRSQFWAKKNPLQPEFVFKGTHKKYWFDCDECPYQFEAIVKNVANGSWCPYCTNQKLCDDKESHDCFNKTMASTDASKFWSPDNEKLPYEVFKYVIVDILLNL